MKSIVFAFCLLLLVKDTSLANNTRLDSLLSVLKVQGNDTNRVYTLSALAREYKTFDIDKALKYSNEGLMLSKKINFPKGEANSLNRLGLIYEGMGNLDKALEMHLESMKIREQMKDSSGIANSLNNIGIVHDARGDYMLAMKHFQLAALIRERMKDMNGLAIALMNIGNVFYEQGDYNRALEFYLKALKFKEESGDEKGVAMVLNNIGGIYDNLGNYQKAVEHYMRALKIKESSGDISSSANTLYNLGEVYFNQKEFKKAEVYFLKALEIFEQIKDAEGQATVNTLLGKIYANKGYFDKALTYLEKGIFISESAEEKQVLINALVGIAGVYLEMKNYKKAYDYSTRAFVLAEQTASKEVLKNTCEVLAKTCDRMGKFAEALKYTNLFIAYKDSIYNEQNSKDITRKEMNFEFEKLQEQQRIEQAKLAVMHEEEIKIHLFQRNTFIGGFILVLLLGAVLFKGYTQKRQDNKKLTSQKEEIERQKEIIEEKNKNVTDSIRYAKNIQDAIFPPLTQIKRILPQSFLLFKPRDIVSGDFYWVEKLENKIYIGAFDCTGHGVPGAFMSIVGYDLIKQAIFEHKKTAPNEILNRVNADLSETLRHSQSHELNIKDGMDACFCSLDVNTLQLEYAGANNSLYIIRKSSGTLEEIKPDKMPIGVYAKSNDKVSFTNHSTQLLPGDRFYLSTDGYADQFGGPDRKKLMSKNFKKVLEESFMQVTEKQGEFLNNYFDAWREDIRQIDDVLVIGVQV